jgi:peptidoglycan/xylan/chitin deacetylase (PgdA/CDA1 family)
MKHNAYITTSWDDGHILDFRIADMLVKHGLTGTFYIPREAGTGVMPESKVRELGQTFEIGAHTMHHVFLDTADAVRSEREIRESKTWVEWITGKPCSIFCPPGGKFRQQHLSQIEASGFTAMRSVELLSIDPPRRCNGLLILPTTLQVHPHSRSAYARNIAKRRAWANLWLYIMHGGMNGWDRMARSILEVTQRDGGVFHIWGHSWEIEQNGQWERLEDVLRMLGDFRREMPCISNGDLARLSDHSADTSRAMLVA